MSFVYLFLTCATKAEAQKIAHDLLNRRLVACAKVVGTVEASFIWKGAISNNKEVLLMMESEESKCEDIESVVESLHSYETFVLSAVPVSFVSKAAKEWWRDALEE